MTIRSLSIVVLFLVAGITASVGWYLDGENEVRGEVRAQPPPARHVPRTAAEAAPRPQKRRLSSQPTPSARAGVSRTPAPAVWINASTPEPGPATSFEPE